MSVNQHLRNLKKSARIFHFFLKMNFTILGKCCDSKQLRRGFWVECRWHPAPARKEQRVIFQVTDVCLVGACESSRTNWIIQLQVTSKCDNPFGFANERMTSVLLSWKAEAPGPRSNCTFAGLLQNGVSPATVGWFSTIKNWNTSGVVC